MPRLALFASGNGSNIQRIADYFSGDHHVTIDLILTNNPQAYVIERATNLKIPSVVFNRKEFYESNYVLDILTVRISAISYLQDSSGSSLEIYSQPTRGKS